MGNDHKKTFAQKAKKLFIKTTLTLTFISAASTGFADTPENKNCVANDNLQDVALKTPQIFRDLSIMEKLPLTGKPVFDLIENPGNNIWSCLSPSPAGTATASTYNNRLANIASGDSSTTTFHEYFHAAQDINGGDAAMARLTMKDAVIAQLLMEATAVAYELAARQEAENRGLTFFDPAPVVRTGPGYVMTISRTSASTNKETRAAFRAAYDAAWNQNAETDAETRMAKALQSGGQAVVRRLLDNADEEWTRLYVQLARNNINNAASAFGDDGREKRAGYASLRRSAYIVIGTVGTISFIPNEYLGPNAAKYIDKCFNEMGFGISTVTPPTRPSWKKPPSL